jgi:hypothetical protein
VCSCVSVSVCVFGACCLCVYLHAGARAHVCVRELRSASIFSTKKKNHVTDDHSSSEYSSDCFDEGSTGEAHEGEGRGNELEEEGPLAEDLRLRPEEWTKLDAARFRFSSVCLSDAVSVQCLFVCMCACLSVSVKCLCERERECVCVCVCFCLSFFLCGCVGVWVCVV